MGSQLLSILRQGFWASLTGGWYYDQRQCHFSNVFHLYIWLLLLCLPLSIEIFLKNLLVNHFSSWLLYCSVVAALFATVKLTNAYLHHLYDTGECVAETETPFEEAKEENGEEKRSNGANFAKFDDEGRVCSLVEALEETNKLSTSELEACRRDNVIPMKLMSSSRSEPRDDVSNSEQSSTTVKQLNMSAPEEKSLKEKAQPEAKSSVQCSVTLHPSVIDLEVDVHHRNSSGSSIAACGSVSSSSAASGRLTTTTTVASAAGNSPAVEKQQEPIVSSSANECKLKKDTSTVTVGTSTNSLSNGSSEEVVTTTQSASSEALLKGGSFAELGFMAQDPSVMRNIVAGSHQENQLRSFKANGRSEAGFSGRRARSELETTNCYSSENNQATLMPPSHPVSLEVIGTSCETGGLSCEPGRSNKSDQKRIKFSSVEVLNHLRKGSILATTKSTSVINDTINPIDELSADEQAKPDISSGTGTPDCSNRERTIPDSGESKQEANEEEESDISLVVNLSSKQASESGNTPKPVKEPKPEKECVASSSCGKFKDATATNPSHVVSDSSFSDNRSVGSSSGCTSDGDDEDRGNESWTSRRSSLSSSGTDTDSDNEKTPLTASTSGQITTRPRSYNITPGRSKTHLSLSPSTPGASQELKLRMMGMFVNKQSDKSDADVRKPKTELERRKKKQQIHKAHDHNHYKKVEASVEEIQDGYQQLSGTEAVLSPSPVQPAAPSTSEGPPAYLLARVLALPNTHLAKSHDDTTTGAVHCFQDERGNWLAYIFDANSMGTARGLMSAESKSYFNCYSSTSFPPPKWDSSSSSSGSNVVLDAPTNILHTPRQALENRQINNAFTTDDNISNHNLARFLTPTSSLFAETFPITAFSPLRTSRRIEINPNVMLGHQGSCTHTLNSNLVDISFPVQLRLPDFASPEPTPPKTKQYYKLWIPPCFKWKYIKIWFDRLQLLALLDRSLTWFELIMSVILAVLVAVFGSLVIEEGLFQDLSLFLFCFVIASCQYTLLKSVQPDAASPTHGYNRIIIYSRPVYFILTCTLILFCKHYVQSASHATFSVYRVNLFNPQFARVVGETAKLFVLSFPIIFTVGLLPQVNTFLMHLLEQMDIHVFGGTAATMGLTSSLYCIIRSLLIVGFLYGFALISTANLVTKSNPDYDVVFSVFCGFLVFLAYHLSRSSSDPMIYWNLIKKRLCSKKVEKQLEQKKVEEEAGEAQEKEYVDPLPAKMEETLLSRLENDIILAVLVIVVVFAVHVSTIFTLQPHVERFLHSLAVLWGFALHYFIANFRKELPWLCFSQPTLKSREYNMFEVKEAARLMWFERFQAWIWLIEKSVIYPLVFLSAITVDTPVLLKERGVFLGTLIVVICTFKAIRSSFNDASHNYLILLFTYLFFSFDFKYIKEPFLVNYFITSIAYHKFYEFLLKMRFIVTYVAPWQITWGSAFHAFAQPFSVPHSGMLFVQAAISSLLSSPLQPLLGSAIFLISYVRPVKFWERDYNTKRVDHSNTRLINQLERNQLGNDDNNLNSIFYEHLTRSLQHSLYGDLALGRWGPVSQGDVFVLASDNLNCLLHIIELGNGLCTFQVRGLEFRGTYCQQREVEAISEGANEDEGCCCCEPGHLPGMLSVNAAFNQRWLAWEVTNTKYVLEGYSISDNSALSMLQPYDLRKALITYYVKCVVYYTVINKRLQKWCKLDAIEAMEKDKDFVDFDITFNVSVDEDYDFIAAGITRERFSHTYQKWIRYCMSQRNLNLTEEEKETVVTLCFCLSLLARRALSAASHHNSFNSVEFLLYGLHSLFKGDFRVTSPRDEWVFQDITLLNSVVAPSVRMALKLHQDHFMSSEEYEDDVVLYAVITNYRKEYVISHEADPAWRNAVLSNVPSLLALRHVFDDGTDQYKIIMLNKRYLNFRVIKVNRECVRGLWAGQQQELVYLRNRNPERGSIQNAKQALRNIINSSCDQPIGYPIYVSPLTTSFAETSDQLARVLGKPLSFNMFKTVIVTFWNRLRTRCGEGCSSGGAGVPEEINSEDIMMRSMSSITTCRHHRQDFCRGSNMRGHRRSSFNEYESSQLLQSCRSKTIVHPSLAYQQQLHLNRRQTLNSSLNSSTLVNLSAFRPLDPQEMDTVVVRGSRHSVNEHQQQMSTVALTTEQIHHRSKGELV